MMANLHLYLASCALLLALSWRTSTGSPVPTRLTLTADKCAQCSSLSKALLKNISEVLKNEELFNGVRHHAQTVVNPKAETALVCAPTLTQHSSCITLRNSSFSETECLGNIMKDLAYYTAVLKSYKVISPDTEAALLDPALEIIQSLQEKCSLMQAEEESLEENFDQMWQGDRFHQRLKMYEMMKGFHVRTITINRAMGYISSGDHRQ